MLEITDGFAQSTRATDASRAFVERLWEIGVATGCARAHRPRESVLEPPLMPLGSAGANRIWQAVMHGLNYYALHLTRIRHAFEEPTVFGSLAPLADAIRDCANRVAEAKSTGDPDYFEVVMDSEAELVENHLGSAFVTCQAFITSLVSCVKALQEHHKRSSGSKLTTTGISKAEIMAFGSEVVPGTSFSRIQVADAFANYYKHRDEWPVRWADLDAGRAQTAMVIQAVGAREGSTGNMRAGARALGNLSLYDVTKLAADLETWKSNVHDGYSAELSGLGLVS